MLSPKFMIGQRVEVLAESGSYWAGKRGEIFAIAEENLFPYLVRFDDDCPMWFEAGELRLI